MPTRKREIQEQRWLPDLATCGRWSNGDYASSLVAVIGDILGRHMREVSFLAPKEPPRVRKLANQAARAGAFLGPLCPRCGQPGLANENECLTCLDCGWSRCEGQVFLRPSAGAARG